VAEACLGIAPRAPAQQALERLESLCGLLRSEDGVCVQTVSCALARAHVEAAIPAWMDLLDSQSRGTRERARRSLEELTGLALGTARARWLAWYESERSWYEEEAPAVLAELDSAEDARVLAALRTLAPRRLEREGLSAEVARLLEHATPAVRLSACSALESLGSSRAVPALSAALADDDAAVARRAWSALRRLTGLELPQDEALWRARFPEP
jgi:HEAT repeat protein